MSKVSTPCGDKLCRNKIETQDEILINSPEWRAPHDNSKHTTRTFRSSISKTR